jgi:hypothetical protein
MASRTVQHRQQAREQRTRQRTEVGRESTGQTGMTMIRALLTGDRAPQRWATSRETRYTHDPATIAQALTGHGRAAPRCAVPPAVAQEDVLAQQWRAGAGHIAGGLQACVPDVETDAPQSRPARLWRSSRSNPLRFAGQAARTAMTGVERTQIDGIESLTAWKGMRERGLERTRWPTSTHGAAWLG